MNARRLVSKVLLALSTLAVLSTEAQAGPPYSLLDLAGNRLATFDPAALGTGVSAAQLVPGAVAARAIPTYQRSGARFFQQSASVEAYATGAGWLVVNAAGPYMNQVRVHVSVGAVHPQSSASWVEVFRAGDDINGNAKAISTMIPIPAGSWFLVDARGALGANNGHAYETTTVTFLPVDDELLAR